MNTNIINQLGNFLYKAGEAVQRVLSVADVKHPIYEDSQEVLQLAQKQIVAPLGAMPNEEVYAFIGVHSKSVLSGKRDSVGFVITNFRVLTQTDVSVISTPKKANSHLFTNKDNPDDLASELWQNFITKVGETIPKEYAAMLEIPLKTVLTIVLLQLKTEGQLPDEIKKATDLKGRIKQLGIEDQLKFYAENEKKYKKFANKHKIEGILLGSLAAPLLFGGLYGFVLTNEGLISRDLMEEAVRNSWQEIKEHPAQKSQEGDAFTIGDKKHFIPAHQKEYLEPFLTLINEIAQGEVSLNS